MNSKYKIPIIISLLFLIMSSCEKAYEALEKVSTPEIQNVKIEESGFVFGDSITLSAKISDPQTTLMSLNYELLTDGRKLTEGEIPLTGNDQDITQAIYVPLLPDQEDHATVQITLEARNVLKGTSQFSIEDVTGSRPEFSTLYLVTDEGTVILLKSQPENPNQFSAENLTLDNSFGYKLAEKINPDNTINYGGLVFGNLNGRISTVQENQSSAFFYIPDADYTSDLNFDSYGFSLEGNGKEIGADDWVLDNFESKEEGGESFSILKKTLEQNKVYTLFGKLASPENFYNPDFFDRLNDNQIKFLGETGEYIIYYNPIRKNIILGAENPGFPDYLLACGWGLGYPTNVSPEQIDRAYPGHHLVHTDWGFDDVLKYILMRKVGPDTYQGTFYAPGEHDHYAQFKLYENTDWADEKQAGDFTFSGEPIITGDNDWTISNGEDDPQVETQIFRFTVNLNDKTVFIEKTTY